MNRIYRLVWNRARCQWVAASELAGSHSRGSRTAVVATLAASLLLAHPAFAQNVGTAGGNGVGTTGGTGAGAGLAPGGGAPQFGSGQAGGNGGNGGPSPLAGGGGGGAGSGGGGGVGSNLSTGTRGFDGGIDGGAGGTDPSFGLLGGGGGGGGGTAGTFSGTQLLPGASTWTGGAGGNAAAGVGVGLGGGGGGGGGGGIGVTAQSSLAVGAGATVAGGAGGAGGAGFKGGSGGGGGAGGQGVVINAGALDNDGSIVGGNGGLGGAGSSNSVFTGPAGAQGGGGEGVLAAGGVTITNNGSISGGLSPDGTVRANAITFTGGGSTLYLNAPSAITGNVVAAGSGNTLGLRGAVDGSFDVSAIGTQYFGFDTFRKLDAVTWTLTGTGAQNWRVDGGTLAGNANSLGGSFNIGAAGTLAYDASLPGSTYSGALSGTGAFIQTGSGTLTLLGDSSAFAGATTVNGTLRIGNGTNVGALGGDITNLGAVVFDRSDDSTYGGAISGAGTLEKTGAGTLTLTGNSNSTGTTTVTAGVLQVGDGGITGALGGGDIVNNATLAFKRSDDVTVANAISGTGSLVQAGAGTTVLTGANTYGGSTTIASGTLQVGAGGASGTLGAGAVIDNAALAFNRSDAVTVANAISGTGSLTQAGSGTTVLTGANSYSGSTTVSAGVLQVGNGGGTGSLGSGAVINNGTLVFNRSGTLTVANAISGAGTLTQAGPGTTVLADDNSYSGSTTISAGTLQVGDGGSGGSLGAGGVTNNGALAFKRSDSITVANVITGTGSLTQAGAGNLVLTGANTYTGGTFVNAGTLSVNGSIVGSTTINNGGTLGGTGTVGSIAVASGGTLAPGNSIGTLSANGNLAFAPGSTYRVEANAAGASDRVNVLGAATITIAGGNVDVRAGGAGYQRNTEYTILSSGGATTGTFDGVTSNLAFLTPTLIYQGNAVLLNLQASDVLNYASVARTGNQAAVANYLGSFANAPGNATAAAVIQQIDNLTADQAASAFASMSGSPHASASQVAGALGRNFSATLAARSGFGPGGLGNAMNDWSRTHYASVNPASLDPVITSDVEMAQASPSRGVETPLAAASERGLWAQSLGAGGRLDSDGNGSGSSYRSNGFVLGYDQPVSSQWLAGGAVGYSRSWWDATSGTAASGTLESPQAGLYARYAADSWRVRLDGTYADHEFTTDRTVTIGSASSVASSSHPGQEWGVAAQVEHPMQMGDWQLKPLAGLRFARLDENGFTETGAGGADLTVADRIMQNTLLSAGMHFVRMFNQDKGGLELRAVASHLAGDNDSPVTASIAGQAGSFTADGTALKRNALTLGATVSGEFSRGVSAYLDANYEYRGSGQSAYQATAGVRASF